ncbi:MAG: hypothetical protein RIS47_1191 [Bacteroidota bacterium]|jgi:argininosuccinate synthase
MEKVLLAFSGGLDTSFCAIWLKEEKGLEVHTALANTGGFTDAELAAVDQKAIDLGVASHINLNVTSEFYQKGIRYMVYGNVLRNNTYPLSVSSERIFQAIAVIEYAKKIGAKYIAHGSTGAGNDQVRFDLTFQVLAPEIQILTPIRDLKLSRQAEIEYLKAHGIVADWKKMEYSINQGIWGTSIGGKETLTTNETLPDAAYPKQLKKEGSVDITLDFVKGELKGLNGQSSDDSVLLIQKLEAIASEWAIGRDMHIGDTIVGIKGRVAFEAAAALITIKAHHTLEKHTLTKWQQYWKEQLASWYGMMLHEAMYLEPALRDIEKMLENSQQFVTGTVTVRLMPYHFLVVGIESEHDMMRSGFGEYGEMNNAWSGDDVVGFTKIISNQLKIYNKVNNVF